MGVQNWYCGKHWETIFFEYASHDVTSHLRVMLDHPYGPMVERPVTPSWNRPRGPPRPGPPCSIPKWLLLATPKKKPPAHHYGAFFHHLWYWWVDMGGFPSKKNPLMTTGTAAKNWDAPTEEVAQLGPSAQTGRFPPTNRENPSKISGLSGILHWFVGFLWLQDDYRSSMVY